MNKEDFAIAESEIEGLGNEKTFTGRSRFNVNMQHEQFTDPRIRQAVHLELDRDEMIDLLFLGDAQYFVFVPQNFPGGLGTSVAGRPGWRENKEEDYAEARALLDAAGKPDGFEMDYMMLTISQGTIDRATLHVEQLKRVNILATLEPVAYADWIPRILEHSFAITTGGGSIRLDMDDHWFTECHTDGSRNDGNISDPELDALIEKQRTLFLEEERIPIWREAEERLLVLGAYPPVSTGFTHMIWQPGIEGMTQDAGRMAYWGHVYGEVSKA